jgi:hypothetical protein
MNLFVRDPETNYATYHNFKDKKRNKIRLIPNF